MRQKWNAEAGHHLLRGLIMAGFAGLIIRLAATGDIRLYIAPHLVIYVNIAAAALIVFTGFQIRLAVQSLSQPVVVCACGHDHGDHTHEVPRSALRSVGLYSLFLLPLLLGAVLPDTAFAGSLAQNKGMNLASGAQVDDGKADTALIELEGDEDPALKQLFRTQPYNRDYAKLGMLLYKQDVIEMKDQWFLEKLTTINKFVDNFQGKSIKITGFIYREPQLASGMLVVGRMAMTHCIADIAPYGMIVEVPHADQYADDQWVTVTGTIGKTHYGERDVMKIIVTGIQDAKASTIPYVYPDLNFASKL